MSTVVNLVIGALIKLISGGFSHYMDFKRQKELSIISRDKDLAIALQSGTDRADWSARITRIFLAFGIIGVWVYIMYYIVVVKPEITYDVFVGKHQSWLWEWLWPFPVNDKGISTVSAGALLWEFKTMVEIVTGFYFTKIGK